MDHPQDTPSESAPCAVCAGVDRRLSGPNGGGLLIVPSTHSTVAAVPTWQRSGTAVVAPFIPGTLAPAELLAQLRSSAPQRPQAAIVFSDQLVSPVHAPLLVEHGGHTEYLSGLEAVAHVGYGLQAAAWTGEDFELAPPACDTAEVLRLLLRHHAACEALGERWLMRGSQAMRSSPERASQARRQLRLFHSALMHAFREGPLPPECRPIVKRLGDMQKRLAGARGA